MKRWARITALAALMLVVSSWEPGRKIAPISPAYEQGLVDSGLRPLDDRRITALLSDATVYATYVLTERKWIEYFDSSGAVVRTTEPYEPGGRGTGRRLLFGSWWGDGDNICFAYGLSRFAECYRLYYRNGSLLYIQTTSSRLVPAGALLAYSTDIRHGDVENFPLIGD